MLSLKRCYWRNGKDKCVHHSPITESNLLLEIQLYCTPDTSVGLVREVEFNIQHCFVWGGRRGTGSWQDHPLSCCLIKMVLNISAWHRIWSPKIIRISPSWRGKTWEGLCLPCLGIPLCLVQSFKSYVSRCPGNITLSIFTQSASQTGIPIPLKCGDGMGVNYLVNCWNDLWRGEILRPMLNLIKKKQTILYNFICFNYPSILQLPKIFLKINFLPLRWVSPLMYTNHSLQNSAIGRLSKLASRVAR